MAKRRADAKAAGSGARYCVDANVLIHLHRDYPPDHFPGIWGKLDALVEQGRLMSAREVLEELKHHEGDVAYAWAKKNKQIFIEVDDAIQNIVVELMAAFPTLAKARLGKTRADPFVIATAIMNAACVITHEEDDDSESRAKIPLVCRRNSVDHARFPSIIVAEGWVFP